MQYFRGQRPAVSFADAGIENSLELRRSVVESSELLLYSASLVAENAMRRYRMAELPVEELRMERRAAVYHRKDGYLPPAAHRLIEILKELGRAIPAGKRRR